MAILAALLCIRHICLEKYALLPRSKYDCECVFSDVTVYIGSKILSNSNKSHRVVTRK